MFYFTGELLCGMFYAGMFKAFRCGGFPQKITYNFVAAIFATIFISMTTKMLFLTPDTFDNDYPYLMYTNTGYFGFDILYIITSVNKGIFHCAVMYHHIFAIAVMYLSPYQYHGYIMIYIGEISNLVSFFTYHYLQRKDTLNTQGLEWLQFFKRLQRYWYGVFRVGVMTALLVILYGFAPPGHYGYAPYHFALPIYLMGLIWTLLLWRKKRDLTEVTSKTQIKMIT